MRTVSIVLALAALAALAASLPLAVAAGPPHLVVFLSDDHGVLDSTVYGATDVLTPHMQRLADEGLVFDRAYVASPSCAPSRAALLTGLMPARNGAEANHSKPRTELKKLPAYLRELGYEVAAFGKVSHYRHTADYGFDYFAHDTFHDPEGVAAALAWLRDRKSEQPLCLFVGANWPHVPWPSQVEPYRAEQLQLPPSHIVTEAMRAMRARYYAAISRMDTELGQVYELARERLGENLVFLHTSDHGAQLPFGKWNCYEAGIRTPMIAVWPGVIAPGTRTDAMVSWIDILPTLVELAGGTAPEQLDGRSFAAVLRGEASAHRDEIFATHSGDGRFNVYPIRSLRQGSWKYILNLHPEYQHATHINRTLDSEGAIYWPTWEQAAESDPRAAEIVQRYRQRPREELYDLSADPHELRNLADDPTHAQRLLALRARLASWMSQQQDQQTVFNEPLLLGEPATPIPRNTPPNRRVSAAQP